MVDKTKNDVFRKILSLRETLNMLNIRMMRDTEIYKRKLDFAYDLILSRGERRAEVDPVYAKVRDLFMNAVVEEGLEAFDQLHKEDFEELFADSPDEDGPHLDDLCYEFAGERFYKPQDKTEKDKRDPNDYRDPDEKTPSEQKEPPLKTKLKAALKDIVGDRAPDPNYIDQVIDEAWERIKNEER
jgi:hypothetical protein